jgi:hypothetical protein
MKKSIYSLLALVLTAGLMFYMPADTGAAETNVPGAAALPALSDVQVVDGPGVRYMIKSYEAAPDYEPDFALLVEEPFEHEGLRYTFQYVSANEVMQTDRKWERSMLSFPVDSEELPPIFQRLEPSIPYGGEDGYSGTLGLDHSAVWTRVEAYTYKSYTLTDTVTVAGLSSNDTSSIPKTREKSGVTMSLVNVDWTVQESTSIGYDTVPTKYTATAHYSGDYSKKVPSEFLAIAWYGGEVEKTTVAKVVYSVTYAAELPADIAAEPSAEPVTDSAAEPNSDSSAKSEGETNADTASESAVASVSEKQAEPEENQGSEKSEFTDVKERPENLEQEPESEKKAANETDNDSAKTETDGKADRQPETPPSKGRGVAFVALAAVVSLAAAAVVVYFNWYNVLIYSGGDSGDGDLEGYKLIAKRRVTPKKLVVDLRGVDFGKNKRLSIEVMESAAQRIKGREIRTIISGDCTSVNVIKKKNRIYRYTVDIPERALEIPDGEDSES